MNNKKYIIIIILLSILVLLLGGYIIYDEFIEKNNIKENTSEENVYKVIYERNENIKSKEIKSIKLYAHEIDLKIVLDGEEDILYINQKNILISHYINKVFILNDILMVDYNNSAHNSGNNLVGYDYNGNKVLDVYNQINDDTTYLYTFKLDDQNNNKTDTYYYVEENRMYIYTTRGTDMLINIPNGKTIDFCDFNDELDKQIITESYDYETLYEIEYLGNYNFKKPKVVRSLKFVDLIELQDIKQYMNNCN